VAGSAFHEAIPGPSRWTVLGFSGLVLVAGIIVPGLGLVLAVAVALALRLRASKALWLVVLGLVPLFARVVVSSPGPLSPGTFESSEVLPVEIPSAP